MTQAGTRKKMRFTWRLLLFKLVKDRQRWIHWLFEAKKRFGLCILNFVVTSNHIHLLVYDNENGRDTIPKSLQLVAGRTAQEYNLRKKRKGAFWEDRYHAVAVETDEHLVRCLIYIDMNMVRAGVVKHPSKWPHGGYCEILNPPKRYRIVDQDTLISKCGFSDTEQFRIWMKIWYTPSLLRNFLRLSRITRSLLRRMRFSELLRD